MPCMALKKHYRIIQDGITLRKNYALVYKSTNYNIYNNISAIVE